MPVFKIKQNGVWTDINGGQYDNSYIAKDENNDGHVVLEAFEYDEAGSAVEECMADIDEIKSQIGDRPDVWVSQTVDMTGAMYSEDTWYPVTGTKLSSDRLDKIRVNSPLDNGVPSWSNHERGFDAYMEVWAQGAAWGSAQPTTLMINHSHEYINDSNNPIGFSQMTNSSTPVVWLRGGGIYIIYTDRANAWTVRTETYEVNSQAVEPTTVVPGIEYAMKAKIGADINGTAANVTGVVGIENGGTGATTAEAARNALGAAPAGYGYGEPCVSFYSTGSESVTNFENALNETLAGMIDKEAKQICVTCTGIADTTLYGTLYRHTADYAIIKLTTYYQDSSITKCKWAGKWEPHSWENPPMIPGVEYRTTERYLGYPVYCYVLDFGTPADGKTMELPNKDNVYCIKLIARTSYTCGTGVTGAYTPGATFGSGIVSLRIVDSTLEGNSSYPVQVIAYYYRPW